MGKEGCALRHQGGSSAPNAGPGEVRTRGRARPAPLPDPDPVLPGKTPARPYCAPVGPAPQYPLPSPAGLTSPFPRFPEPEIHKPPRSSAEFRGKK